MKKLRSPLIFALVLSLASTGCATAISAPTRTPSALPSTTPPATSSPTPEPVGVGVPVIQYVDGGGELLVISSVTGKTFESYAPIAIGNYDDYALAPDGHTLAVSSEFRLYLIDLPSWKYRTAVAGVHGLVNYSPDGRLVALASAGADGALAIIDTSSGDLKASAQVGFSIRNARFTRDGTAVMVYGPHLASAGIAANAGVSVGPPMAALLAASDLSPIWSVQLNGVRDGVFPKKAGTADTQAIYEPGAAWFFQPGVAFAPAADVLYVVHGDADQLTSVDFTTRKVRTVDVRPRLSWLEQLLALTAGVAHAKGMDGITKQAVISPDGKFLYVVGSNEKVTQQPNSENWDVTDSSIGLEVIAAEDGTLVDKIDTQANSAALSPDGQQVLLRGWNTNSSSATPWTDVYDLSSKQLILHLDGIYLIPTHRLDGETMLGSSNQISDGLCDIASVDPAAWSVTSHWQGTVCAGWLMEP